MNISAKEELIEELDEHLRQVSYCTLSNPFDTWLTPGRLHDWLLASEQISVTGLGSINTAMTYEPNVDHIVKHILSRQ